MNKPSPSLYERVAQQHVSRFSGAYDGSVNAAALVVSSREPSAAARAALAASFRTLGYASTSIGWAQTAAPREAAHLDAPDSEVRGAVLCTGSLEAGATPGIGEPGNPAPNAPAQPNAANPGQTESGNLFTLIEAICPLCVVSLDRDAATALSHDFNTPLPLEARTLLMGHGCICFQDFEGLLSGDEGKQKAWALLKTLPKMP